MLMRKITLFAALGLAMALSTSAMADHLGPSNRGGNDPQGDNRASEMGQSKGKGQVSDIDNAAEDAGRGNGSETTTDHDDADPGNSKSVNQGGD